MHIYLHKILSKNKTETEKHTFNDTQSRRLFCLQQHKQVYLSERNPNREKKAANKTDSLTDLA